MTLAASPALIGHEDVLEALRPYRGHALVLSGPARVGKRVLARHIAALFNCREAGTADDRSGVLRLPQAEREAEGARGWNESGGGTVPPALEWRPRAGAPCGHCPSCRMALTGAHPDLLEIGPRVQTATGKTARRRIIPVGAMVEGRGEAEGDQTPLVEWLETAPTVRRKVAVIDGAEFMTAEAANAILKSVEEPPFEALFVFLAEDVHAVLPTIVSRCTRLNVNPLPDRVLAAALTRLGEPPDPDLLRFAAGRPGMIVERDRARAALLEAGTFQQALADGMLPALEGAEVLEKRFDPHWHPEALRFTWQDLAPESRARADSALERLLVALEQYVSPSLAFQVFALEMRAAVGEA